jgi:L-cysteate sulfo-lyase
MGGNKTRQLEFYCGQAISQGCDTLLTSGAVQSNHVRTTIAAARKLGWHVEVQLEHVVDGRLPAYSESGNPFLNKLMGAPIHIYRGGENALSLDQVMYGRAEELKAQGYHPFVIPVNTVESTPWGALGYVEGLEETLLQAVAMGLSVDAIVLPTGSANTQAGVLAGLIALHQSEIPVYGFCVRRDQLAQRERVLRKTRMVLQLLGLDPDSVSETLVHCEDWVLGQGYGQFSTEAREAIALLCHEEGLLLDPAYSGKCMAGLIRMVQDAQFENAHNVLFLHTGGTPVLFGYPELVIKNDAPSAP